MSNYAKSFPRRKFLGNRDKFLIEESRELKTIHFGCTDWPNQENQIQNGQLLHIKLLNQASQVIGVDVDASGIEHLSGHFPNQKFIYGDIASSDAVIQEIVSSKPKLVLVPDVLEHIENQRDFLSALRKLLHETSAKAIITTPNAFALKTFLPLFIGKDFTHTDHCLLHNEFTLEHALKDAGFINFSINYLSRDISGRYGLTAELASKPLNFLSKKFPRFADTLVATLES